MRPDAHPQLHREARLSAVQALRGIAALWVVLYHCNAGNHLPRLRATLPEPMGLILFDAGHLGVSIFFALSGYVIAHSLVGAELGRGFFGRFVLRRSIRLDPPYWASMVFVVAMAWLSARLQQESFALPSPGEVVAHGFYLQELLQIPTINVVYWTLTYEVQFYLFFTGLFVAAHRFGARMPGIDLSAFVWTGMTLLAIGAASGAFDDAPHGLFFHLWSSFFVGALARRALEEPETRVLFAVLLLVMLVQASEGKEDSAFLRVSAGTALFLYVASLSRWIVHGWNWRWLQYLGAISYSLYLIHNPLTGAAAFVTKRSLGPGLMTDVVVLAAALATSIAGAALFWLAIERQSQSFSRRFRLNRTPARTVPPFNRRVAR